MKYLFTLIFITLISISISAQGLQAENCSFKNVELLSYSEGLDKNEVIVSFATFLYGSKINSFEDLTEKELKEIKKYAPRFKSCKIYIDFDAKMQNNELNPWFTDNHLRFVCVMRKKGNLL